MDAPEQQEPSRDRARRIVKFWRKRGWLTNASPIQVHFLDTEKLEELIAEELDRG